jgi:hypothetical protein
LVKIYIDKILRLFVAIAFLVCFSIKCLNARPVETYGRDSIFSSHLPIISIQTNNQVIVNEPRISAGMTVFRNENGLINCTSDQPGGYTGQISIELRGKSSLGFEKKCYGFETQRANGDNKNVKLLGLPKENDWILYGPYSDKTLIRNVLIYELARELGGYASRTVFCEVLINDDYKGLYVLMEKIKRDKNRVNIDKLSADDNPGDSVSGGYIIKVDWSDDGIGYDWTSPITSFTGNPLNINYQFEYPDREDITGRQAAYIENYFTSFEHAHAGSYYTNAQIGYRRYIDVHSFIDYFIMNELANNVDAYRLSNYYTKVRSSKGGKLFAGPVWDFNLGFGNANYDNGWSTTVWSLENPYFTEFIPFHLKRLREDPEFEALLRCRWNSLRETSLSKDSIYAVIDSLTAHLGPAVERNFDRWQIMGVYVWPNVHVGSSYENEINYLKGFIHNRLNWMDNNLFIAASACGSDYEEILIVSEINHQSGWITEAGYWFELFNKGTSSLDLSGWTIKNDNNLNTYTIPVATVLDAGEYLVIAGEKSKFHLAYPEVLNIIGSFNWYLGSTDKLRIYDRNGYLACEINYRNEEPWPVLSSDNLATMEIIDVNSSLNNPDNWFAGCSGGSPGGPYQFPCPSVSIEDLGKQSLSAYPNPFDNQLKLVLQEANQQSYELLTIEGKTLISGSVHGSETTIDTSKLPPGFYLLKVTGEVQFRAISLVKVK